MTQVLGHEVERAVAVEIVQHAAVHLLAQRELGGAAEAARAVATPNDHVAGPGLVAEQVDLAIAIDVAERDAETIRDLDVDALADQPTRAVVRDERELAA